VNLRDDPVALQELIEADEQLRDDLEHSRRHGPVVGEDFSVEAELISPELRRRYRETGAFS
jgi:hypothetical protein